MYWDLGLLPGTSKKWKARPVSSSAGNAQNTALNQAGSFGGIWYLKTGATKVKKL